MGLSYHSDDRSANYWGLMVPDGGGQQVSDVANEKSATQNAVHDRGANWHACVGAGIRAYELDVEFWCLVAHSHQ